MTPARSSVGIAACVGALLLASMLATERLATPWVVAGRSMEPTLRQGDRVLVDRWTYRHRRPRLAEVVLLHGPSGVALVKRVAAPREAGPAGDDVWVLGDNADHSVDSRRFGPVPTTRLRGRVVFRYWPPSRAGPIR